MFSHKGSLLTHKPLFLQLPFLLQLLQDFPPQTIQVYDQRRIPEQQRTSGDVRRQIRQPSTKV